MSFWNFFKKKPEPEKALAPSRGFFSTEEDNYFDRRLTEEQNALVVFGRSFQKKITDMRAIDASGEMVAMDEAYPGLQQVKLQNTLYGYLPFAQLCWYASQGFIGYQTAAMISQNWLVDKACSMPARDAVRHGYELSIQDGIELDPKVLDYIRKKDKQFRIKDHCVEFLRMGRVFGIRIAMFEVASPDEKYYEKPFNIDGVGPGTYKGISQIDPYWITPELDGQSAANPASRHFYEPTWWRINGRRIHRSHLIIMRNGGELPDILKPTYFYGGIPVPQKIAERVYAAERVANEAPLLAMSKRLTTLNLDITQALANKEAFEAKMQQWTELQNNFGVKVVGEKELINQFDTTLNDLDAVIMTQYQIVSAAAEVPATKLLGTSPKGFGASGEYEESSYHEMLESLQEHELSPLVNRHHQLLIQSEVAQKFSIKPFATEVLWKPTDSPTAKEQAEINKLKADTDTALVQAGGIDGTDVRQRLIQEDDSGYNGIEEIVPGGPGDREAQQQQQEALEAPVQGRPRGAPAQDSVDDDFDPARGMLNGARLITHQKFLDEAIVERKLAAGDFTVNVTPEFMDDGKLYRMLIDGHHSLAAAMRAHVKPNFITSIPRDEVFNAATRQATDSAK